jgi:hypothetical protein
MKWIEIITLRSPSKINGQFIDELLNGVDESDEVTDRINENRHNDPYPKQEQLPLLRMMRKNRAHSTYSHPSPPRPCVAFFKGLRKSELTKAWGSE